MNRRWPVEGAVWQVRRDGRVVADITLTEPDFPWLHGRLRTRAGFADLEPLLADVRALDRAVEDDDSPATVAAQEAAHARLRAAIELVPPDGDPVTVYLLHVDGDDAWIRTL